MSELKMERSLADMALEQHGYTETFLDKVTRLISWKPIDKIVRQLPRSTQSVDGRPAYPSLVLFKILLMQRWYTLSDPAMEEALRDRLSFRRFAGLPLTSAVPDHSTLSRFRKILTDSGMYERILAELNRQLETHGLLVKTGVIVDATLVASSRRPRKVLEHDGEETTVSYSDDTDAQWMKKGKDLIYGYKAHAVCDDRDGYILGGDVTAANVAETTHLEQTLETASVPRGAVVLGDKGYASKDNRRKLKEKGLGDGLMHKASRNHPLTETRKQINRILSSIRYKIERAFGALKKWYGFNRMRYLGSAKGRMEFYLNAIAFNMKKAAVQVV